MAGVVPTRDAWQTERRWLGYAGLIPFVVCTAVLLTASEPAWIRLADDTLRSYSAVIASFLGAVHWGAAADDRDGLHHARLRWGVMPALIAWTLLALPSAAALLGFAILFAFVLVVDRYLLPVLDDAYRRMRLQLTSAVIVCLLVAATGAPGGLQ